MASDQFSLVQFSCSVMSDSLRPHVLQHTRLPSLSPSPRVCSNSGLLSVIASNHLSFVTPFAVFSLSQHQGLVQKSALHIRWPKYWSFSFSPSNEYSGLIPFRIDWFDLLAVLGTLKSLLQHHSSKASTFQCLAFFMVQFSHLYMITGKTIALSIQTFVSKVMSLLFNTLSRFVKAFLPRNKHLLILWLMSLSAVILEPPKIKSVTVSIFSPFICQEVMGPDAMMLVF